MLSKKTGGETMFWSEATAERNAETLDGMFMMWCSFLLHHRNRQAAVAAAAAALLPASPDSSQQDGTES